MKNIKETVVKMYNLCSYMFFRFYTCHYVKNTMFIYSIGKPQLLDEMEYLNIKEMQSW